MKKKVAAYCRVSTQEELQQYSLESQKEYYKELIESNQDFIFVGIYADTASGLKKKDRVQFEKMIKDCRRKKIDIIYTKSISRFSRNSLDFLKVIRKLKQLEVDVYFQNEQIWLKKERSEFNMAVHVAVAQEESMCKSRSIRWGLVYGFQSGDSKLANRVCYGYEQDKDGKLIINEKEAENVKLIFALYLQGYSLSGISKELKRRGVASPTGKEIWTSAAIDKILGNEKYIGQALLQKTYIPDVLAQKQEKNKGALTQYLYENNHRGIIEVKTFEKVQKMKKDRSNKTIDETGENVRRQNRYSSDGLSGKIICGECGRSYRRITTHKGDIVWRCAARVEKGDCKAEMIKQIDIDNKIMEVFEDKEAEKSYKLIDKIIISGKELNIVKRRV